MKRIVFIIIVFVFCLQVQAQKITALTEATTIDNSSLFMVRAGATGDLLKKITLANILKDRTFTGTITLPATTSIGTVSATELGYVNNVTSAIQTQINEKETRIDSLVTVLADSIPLSEVAQLLAPDTVQHAISYIVAASDWTKDQHCNKATSILITIPPNLSDWPVGGVMNFYGEGAGIMVFKKGSGVTFISDSDSIATSRKGQAVSIKKIATNKYFLIGALID